MKKKSASAAARSSSIGGAPRGRPRETGKESTRSQLLDAAEYCFAERGYHGVAVRDIANLAKVQVGLLSYYFPTKEGLFVEVIQRRADEHTSSLAKSLSETLTTHDEDLSAEHIITAYIRPALIAIKRDEGWSNYIRLLAREGTYPLDAEPFLRAFAALYDPVERDFIKALERIYPSAQKSKLWSSFHCLAGIAVFTFMDLRTIQRMSRGKFNPTLDELCDDIVQFIAAGYERLATAGTAPRVPARRVKSG